MHYSKDATAICRPPPLAVDGVTWPERHSPQGLKCAERRRPDIKRSEPMDARVANVKPTNADTPYGRTAKNTTISVTPGKADMAQYSNSGRRRGRPKAKPSALRGPAMEADDGTEARRSISPSATIDYSRDGSQESARSESATAQQAALSHGGSASHRPRCNGSGGWCHNAGRREERSGSVAVGETRREASTRRRRRNSGQRLTHGWGHRGTDKPQCSSARRRRRKVSPTGPDAQYERQEAASPPSGTSPSSGASGKPHSSNCADQSWGHRAEPRHPCSSAQRLDSDRPQVSTSAGTTSTAPRRVPDAALPTGASDERSEGRTQSSIRPQ